jgi:hypothetical protein
VYCVKSFGQSQMLKRSLMHVCSTPRSRRETPNDKIELQCPTHGLRVSLKKKSPYKVKFTCGDLYELSKTLFRRGVFSFRNEC